VTAPRRFVLAALLLLTGCGAESTPEEVPHGYVAGAEETAEAQARLVVADAGTGQVRVLDLITEDVTDVGQVTGGQGIRGIRGDGRFAYLTTDRSVHLVDSGSWMVDHVDHVHYYRADIRDVGTIRGEQAVSAHSDTSVTAVSFADGAVTLLDRADLERGTVSETATIDLGEAVPYREHVLTATEVRDRAGEPVSAIDEPCPQPAGTAVTRRGVVFGCADGALLITEKDGTFTAAKIAYPPTDAGPVREFRHRRSSATLVGVAEHGVWLLDLAKRAWTLLPTGPVVAVNTAGAGTPVLTLTSDGVLHAIDPATGVETARTALLAQPSAATPPVIEIDATRAYVNDATAGVIHEIDYNDNLRVARTFTLDSTPTFMVETGR
jgi:hypothetical protein